MWNLRGRRLVYLLHVLCGKICREHKTGFLLRSRVNWGLEASRCMASVEHEEQNDELAYYVFAKAKQSYPAICYILLLVKVAGTWPQG